jgi:short-subunit dehydrogenase
MTSTAIWITGASSGIGAALRRTVPVPNAHVFGIARRASEAGDLRLDLSEPPSWHRMARHFETVLETGVERALLLHFAGTGEPHGRVTNTPFDEYAAAVVTNGAAGPVLGKVVLCSSPAASEPMPGMSSYGSGKVAMEYWVRAVAAEQLGRVLGIVPFAVDTPMVRQAMEQPGDTNPVAGLLREAAANDALAAVEDTAAEIWDVVLGDLPSGSVVAVGAVPIEVRAQGPVR